MATFSERIGKLNTILCGTRRTVFFGGAGVSTESGIPDFRSKDGLYNTMDVQFEQYSPEYLLSHDCLFYEPKVFFAFYRQKMNVEGIEPNAAHKKLAEMEEKGRLSGVITQNIDGLHQKAGSKNVIELHGSTLRNYCSRCRRKVDPDFIFKSEGIPHCPKCGGMIRPDVTLYGEMLPDGAMEEAERLVRQADCLIIGGTSLVVWPAAGLVRYFRGDHLVIMNMQETASDHAADLIFREKIGTVLGAVEVTP